MFFRIRWIRRLLRRTLPELPQEVAEKWHRRLSFLYLFTAWNAFGFIIYKTKAGKLDFSSVTGLQTEEEAKKSKAVVAMEMYRIPKARVITARGTSIISDEEKHYAPSVVAMEMYRIPKARVITARGTSIISDEEVINEFLIETEENDDDDDDDDDENDIQNA